MHKPKLFLSLSTLAIMFISSPVAAASQPSPTPKPTPVKVAANAMQSTKSAVASPAKAEPKRVEVQSGDSLSSIADDQKLDSWRLLWNANTDLENPDVIYPGQQLIVPEGPTDDRPLPEGVAAQPVAAAGPVVRQTAVHQASAANYAAGAGGIFQRIRQRESGGNYAINTGNGFYGAYQFDLRTWQGVGGSGLPSNASPAEQDMRAQMLYNQRGCAPWPNTCY